MAYYVISDGQGKYIRHDGVTGKYVPIASEKSAQHWDSYTKALGVLNNSIAKAIRSNYKVEVKGNDDIVKKDFDKLKEICDKNVTTELIEDWIPQIENFVNLIKNCNQLINGLSQKLSYIDKELSDVTHFIEFGRFNVCEGYKTAINQQTLLRERRKVKNKLNFLAEVKRCKFNPTDIKSLSESIERISERKYTPRVITEIFNSIPETTQPTEETIMS